MRHPINDVVWCKLAPSPIHGVGVFAIRNIMRGTELFGGEQTYPIYDDTIILKEIWDLMQDHWLDLENRDTLPNPNWDANLQCFMNHSDTPNSDGHYAIRDIAAGEEVTEDFRKVVELGPDARKYFTFIK